MAKKNKPVVKERIPEGMSRKDYADAAFRKKVTIIMASILAVFVIGVCAVIFTGWYNNEQLNKEFQQEMEIFNAEAEQVKATLKKNEEDGGSLEDKAQVKIEVTDTNFIDWINVLDASYQCGEDDEAYAAYGGATIHLQGLFVTREFKGGTQYWVYRKHTHEDGAEHNHDHEEGESHEEELNIGEMIPIEVILDYGEEIPENGAWVDVTGVVGPDSTRNLSAVRLAKIKVCDEKGTEYVD